MTCIQGSLRSSLSIATRNINNQTDLVVLAFGCQLLAFKLHTKHLHLVYHTGHPEEKYVRKVSGCIWGSYRHHGGSEECHQPVSVLVMTSDGLRNANATPLNHILCLVQSVHRPVIPKYIKDVHVNTKEATK